VAQHLHRSDRGGFARHLDRRIGLAVAEAHDKEEVRGGRVYVAPANYHMLVERDGTLALSVDGQVNWSRPSIDVLFESAARVWGPGLIGIVLSGANHDGAAGMRLIADAGGLAVAQDPATAERPEMPRAAIEEAGVETVLAPAAIGELLRELGGAGEARGDASAEQGGGHEKR
jgi:two-component system chemotaxis response regulator CheB